MDMDTSLEPTEHERRTYYIGLPSCPRLVARSSTEPWSYDPLVGWPDNKYFHPVGNHPIVDKWNDDSPNSLRVQVVALVAARGLQWHAIDVLRIGSRNPSPDGHPVVVFISVEADSLTWRHGRDVAIQCTLLLAQHELYDVQCEIKESQVFNLAAPPKISRLSDDAVPSTGLSPYAEEENMFSDGIGNGISPQDTPAREGTSCLFLRDAQTHATYALTCRHVCFGSDGPGDSVQLIPNAVPGQSSAALQKRMIQPGDQSFDQALEDIGEQRRIPDEDDATSLILW